MGIIEGNKLIAEFMGLKPNRHDGGRTWTDSEVIIKGQQYSDNDWKILQYHSSWDWLMPVVEKIRAFSPDHEICISTGKTFCTVAIRDLDNGKYLYDVETSEDKPQEAIYKAVVQFIQWHNAQPTP